MHDIWMRIVENLHGRVGGTMNFRFILQPVMAAIFAILAGLKDAKAGRPVYGWALFSVPAERAALIKDGWKDVSKVFILALVLDVVYQVIEFRFVYPGETLLVAFVLAILPYLLLRGVINRIASRM